MPHADPEVRKAYNKRYREANRERLNAYKREWFKERYDTDEEFRAKVIAEAKKRPDVARAHSAVYQAIKRGELVRPNECEECHTTDVAIEAAHSDYEKPLEVKWLCRKCHREWDSEYAKII